MESRSPRRQEFIESLNAKKPVIAAEGYLLELERRCYNRNGSFVPTAVLDHPEKVEEYTRELVHAGSDISQAFVYYAHEKKMEDIGRGGDFKQLNKKAHDIAKKVAMETNTFFCAGIGTTNVYDPNNDDSLLECEKLFRNQISTSAECGVDFIVIECQFDYKEASIALKVAKEYGVPAVVTLAPLCVHDEDMVTYDAVPLVEALQLLESEGAACVGLNCMRGPYSMVPLVKKIRPHIKGPLACVSLGFRTTEEQKTWYQLTIPGTDTPAFPDNLGSHYLCTADVEWYADQLKEIGVEYVGFCCGNAPTYTRTLAMAYGKNPPGAKYVSDYKTKNSMVSNNSYTSTRYSKDMLTFRSGGPPSGKKQS